MTKDGIYKIDELSELATTISDGGTATIDLSGLAHDRHRHTDPTELAVLAWWLLSAERSANCSIAVPSRQAACDVLGRTGVLSAAARRNVTLTQNGEQVAVESIMSRTDVTSEVPFPNVDWQSYDELDKGTRLRAIPDLEDPRREPPDPIPRYGNRRYDWLDTLGAAGSLSQEERYQYFRDVDTALYEPISNVHLWAKATRAIAVGSVTRGGETSGSFDRFHIVVMDDGLGIPAGLMRKRFITRRTGEANWRPELEAEIAKGNGISWADDLETALLQLLVEEQFSDRVIRAASDGQGLHALGMVAKRRKTQVEILTGADDSDSGEVVHVSGGSNTVPNARRSLPGARGTLVHMVVPTARRTNDDDEVLRESPTVTPVG